MTDKCKMPDMLGGQALIEGVMMKGKNSYAISVYDPDKKLINEKYDLDLSNKRFFKLPFIRGVYNMYEMLKIGISSLNRSVAINMPEESDTSTLLSTIISLVIVISLFMILPAYVFKLLSSITSNIALLNLMEGALRILIFLTMLSLISLDKEIRRVFAYHGAEHKTVHAYESGDKLTVANIKKHSRLHPRCGTAFVMLVIIISILVYSLLGIPDFPQRVLYKLLLLPVIVSVTYEVVRLVIKLPRILMYFILLPGIGLQLITTKEPDDDQIKAAISAIEQVID